MGRLIRLENQGASNATPRNVKAVSAALSAVLEMFADPIARKLKVRSGMKAGGICIQCGGNHNRNGLVVR